MTRGQAVELVAYLAAAFPRADLPDATVAVYAEALADLDHDQAREAVHRLIRTRTFFPAIAEIRDEVVRTELDSPEPELAWGDVLEEVRRVGAREVPSFPWPEMQAAVDAVGWRDICLDENVAASRARFVDAYRAARGRRIRDAVAGELALASGGRPELLGSEGGEE